MRGIVIATLILITTGTAVAETWTCRNEAVEVSCGDGTCTVADGFTPMSVSVSEAGEMSLCAYTGCWEGSAVSVLTAGDYLVATGADLRWSHTPLEKGVAGTMTVNRADRSAAVLVEGYVNPMSCEKDDSEN